MTLTRRFKGFPPEAMRFFKQLARHNNRDWFQAHKDVYEQACREPMKDLLDELGPRFGPGHIRRINRDIRFSRDKSPYRTHIAAGIGGNYIHLAPTGLYIGAGIYKPEPVALQRFRSAVDGAASGRKLQSIVTTLRRKGYKVDTHQRLASAPRGYAADHPRLDLLRMKDIFAGKTFAPAGWLSTRQAFERVKNVMTDTAPLVDWIRINVGSRQ